MFKKFGRAFSTLKGCCGFQRVTSGLHGALEGGKQVAGWLDGTGIMNHAIGTGVIDLCHGL